MRDEAMHRGKEMRALLAASAVVRAGNWIKGAPTHVLAELLQALEERGWRLLHESDPRLRAEATAEQLREERDEARREAGELDAALQNASGDRRAAEAQRDRLSAALRERIAAEDNARRALEGSSDLEAAWNALYVAPQVRVLALSTQEDPSTPSEEAG